MPNRSGKARVRAGTGPAPAGAEVTGRSLAEGLAAVMRLLRISSSRAEVGGLSNARYEFLHVLVHGGPMRMGAVARELGISSRTVTPMVDALEGDGLVVRAPDPADRRAQVLSLTPAGLRLMRRVHDARIALAAPLFGPLDPAERATLGRLLAKIIEAAQGDPAR